MDKNESNMELSIHLKFNDMYFCDESNFRSYDISVVKTIT